MNRTCSKLHIRYILYITAAVLLTTFIFLAYNLSKGHPRHALHSSNPNSHSLDFDDSPNPLVRNDGHFGYKNGFRYLPVKPSDPSWMKRYHQHLSSMDAVTEEDKKLEKEYFIMVVEDQDDYQPGGSPCNKKVVRLGPGPGRDGGWYVCQAPGFELLNGNCLVYSFGVGEIWGFVDDLAKKYGCTVRAFDPTIDLKDHMRSKNLWFYHVGIGGYKTVKEGGQRKIETFQSLLKRFHEYNSTVDILKIDVEFSEWASLTAALHSGSLRNVKQLMFESHTRDLHLINERTNSVWFKRFLGVLHGLRKAGFRQWRHEPNQHGIYLSENTNLERHCCYVLYFINTKFINNKKRVVKKFHRKTRPVGKQKIHKTGLRNRD